MANNLFKEVTTDELKRNLKLLPSGADTQTTRDIKAELSRRSPSLPKTTKKNTIESQIAEATAAGNFEDVATLKGLSSKDKPIQPVTTVQDNLQKQSSEATKSLLSALKQRINESVGAQKQLIERTPQQYDPLRAQSEVAKAQSLRSALERSSNLGDRGGIGRSEALATQTAGENRLANINLAEKNQIADANAEIARLENEGRFQEAQIVSGQKAQLLQNLIAQQNRDQDIARQDRFQTAGLTGTLDGQRTMAGQQFDLGVQQAEQQAQESAFSQQLQTIGQYSQDYDAEIRRRQAVNPNDPLIPYLIMARNQKIAGIEASNAEQIERNQELALEQYDRAFKLWEKSPNGANEYVSPILGIGLGEMATDALKLKVQTALDREKLNLSRAKEARIGSSTPKITKGDVWATWEQVKDNPAEQVGQFLTSNAKNIINTLGKEAYDSMVSANKLKATKDSFFNTFRGE